jgi:hypothetical protein
MASWVGLGNLRRFPASFVVSDCLGLSRIRTWRRAQNSSKRTARGATWPYNKKNGDAKEEDARWNTGRPGREARGRITGEGPVGRRVRGKEVEM